MPLFFVAWTALAPVRTICISDLHLSAHDERTHARFLSFTQGFARTAERLYLLGDLFDQWLGDAQVAHDPYAASVVHALRAISDSGVEIRMLVGNRDFMMSTAFAQAIGATLIEGPCVEAIDGQRILLLHGDELCTEDVAYQRARRILRSPLFRLAVAPLPFVARNQIAQYLRRRSGVEKKVKSAQIMDATESAVIAAFEKYDVDTMIHGHTHRPAIHQHVVGTRRCTRYVLDDWQAGAGITVLENGRFSHVPWAAVSR